MSLIRIVHETSYFYKHPVRFGPHRLIVRPREGHDVHVEEHRLEIEPRFSLEWSRDVFGNSVATATFDDPGETLSIRSEVILKQTAPFPSPGLSPVPVPFPVRYAPVEQVVAGAYQTTTFPADVGMVSNWVWSEVRMEPGVDAEEVISRVNQRVRSAIRYTRRETQGVQSPAETLASRTGSCRDLSTLLLEALRVLGFPARFVSGYLDCVDSLAGVASTHAWVEAYLPKIGWVGYDPTLGRAVGHQHVAVGVSNHPRGVMPVTGVFFGKREEYLEMKVAVMTERVEQLPAFA